jgi:hypothetical protein
MPGLPLSRCPTVLQSILRLEYALPFSNISSEIFLIMTESPACEKAITETRRKAEARMLFILAIAWV